MINMKKTLFTIGALLIMAAVYAQQFTNDWGNYMKPSPGSYAAGQDLNVNEATGAVAYNVNLYALSQDDQSFPISLNYYSTGIRIDDYASFVGLGWNLNAGGMITKMVRGLDDEEPTKGYRANYATFSSISVDDVKSGDKDGEPDVYAFNMFGRSGKFVFHPTTGKYIPLNAEDILINWVTSPAPHFEITDQSGTVFHFTLQEETNMKSVTNGSAIKVDLGTVVTGWFLTKIVQPDRSEINISYTARTITELPTTVKETDIARYEQGDKTMCSELNPNGTYLPRSYSRVAYFSTYTTHRISSITYKTGLIEFSYASSQRSDMPGDYALELITVKDEKGFLQKKYQLAYTAHSGRLLLQSVACFEGSAAVSLTLNTFSYYTDHTMPAPATTVSQDEYGYFNGADAYTTNLFGTTVNTLLPELPGMAGTHQIDGANRNFGTTSQMQTLMLKSVKTLEGGTLTIAYEPNQFNGNDPFNAQYPYAQNRQGPGLRVALLTSNDNNKHNYYTRYSYVFNDGISTGMYINQYAFSNNLTPVKVISNRRNPDPNEATATDMCNGALRFSDRRAHVPMSLSSPIYYKAVKIMQFSDPSNESGSSNGFVIKSFSSDPSLFNTTVHNVREYMFGNLLSVTTHNKSGQAVASEEYTYEYTHAGWFSGKSVYLQVLSVNKDDRGTPYAWDDQYSYAYTHNFIRYEAYIGRRDLKEKKSFRTGTGAMQLAHVSEVYSYDTLHNLVQIQQFQKGVLRYTTQLKRSYQYNTLSTGGDNMNKALYYMKNSHIHAPVIESVTTTHTATSQYTTAAALQLYKLSTTQNMVLPAVQLSLRQAAAVPGVSFTPAINSGGTFTYDPKYEAMLAVDRIDENNKPVQVSSRKDTVSSFNTLEQSYCTVNKALFAEIAYCGFEYFEANQINSSKPVVGNLAFSSTCSTISTDAFAGAGSFGLSSCSASITNELNLTPAKKYFLQLWRKGTVTVTAQGGPAFTGTAIGTSGDWTLMEYVITGTEKFFITGTGYIDEIKLFRQGAAMTTTSLDALGRALSESDANNHYTHYEYDEYGRLRTVYDTDRNIIKRYEYAIQNPQ